MHVPRMWLRKLGCNVKTAFFSTAPRSWPCGLRTYTVCKKERWGGEGGQRDGGEEQKQTGAAGPLPRAPSYYVQVH